MTAPSSKETTPINNGRSDPNGITQWDRVAAMDEFRQLLVAKESFVVPATVFFIVYYFALPVLVGYAPKFMDKPILGPVNIAYLFALSQFFMAWGVAWLYVRAARRFDSLGDRIHDRLTKEGKVGE